MSSNFLIRSPYVLATLPRPLDHTNGRIVAREVFGRSKDGVKRKRSEVVVGIDGEAVSIYDVSAPRLITSYPIPPSESFCCAPYSLRIRLSETVYRYTVTVTRDGRGSKQKLTLFKDVVDAAGKTVSTTVSQVVEASSNIIHFDVLPPLADAIGEPVVGSIVAVCRDGQVLCHDGNSLRRKWAENSKALVLEATSGAIDGYTVQVAAGSSSAKDNEGSAGPGRASVNPLLASFKGSNLVLVATVLQKDAGKQYVLVLSIDDSGLSAAESSAAAATTTTTTTTTTTSRLMPLQIAPLPTAVTVASPPNSAYQIDSAMGHLLELDGSTLNVYDLLSAVPKLISNIVVPSATSFMRLTSRSILSCSPKTISIYNHLLRSVQSRHAFDLTEPGSASSGEAATPPPQSVCIIRYFRLLDAVVVLMDNNLVSIPLEPPKRIGKKRRLDGLLIDSIGRGESVKQIAVGSATTGTEPDAETAVDTATASNPNGGEAAIFQAEKQAADELLEQGNVVEFEKLMASKFGVTVGKGGAAAAAAPEWKWKSQASEYAAVNPRWILYAIERAFSASTGIEGLKLEPALLPTINVLIYLVIAGHLTLSNLKTAFKARLMEAEWHDKAIATEVVRVLGEIDPTLDLLVRYVSSTRLDALELALAIKTIMRSLDLVKTSPSLAVGSSKQAGPTAKNLLTDKSSGDDVDMANNGDGDGDDNDNGNDNDMEIDQLEEALDVTEYHLGDESSTRARGLTTALVKLGSCSAAAIVGCVRSTFDANDILSLIYLLRVELVRGAWTARYLDSAGASAGAEEEEEAGGDAPPDGIITLIASLLSRCLDALGPSGWFLTEGGVEGEGFLGALQLEVNAALEGLQEAVYLHGVVSEAVRYGTLAQQVVGAPDFGKPIPIHPETREAGMLPLGVGKVQAVQTSKVVAGGEVVGRTLREIGHVKSQKVGVYTLEKLAI